MVFTKLLVALSHLRESKGGQLIVQVFCRSIFKSLEVM